MARGIDRRAARTRRALHEALTALIQRKGYEAVTVQDLLDEADVGRSTFYAHFTSKEDLLRRGFERLREHLVMARSSSARPEAQAVRPLPFSLALFEHVRDFTHVYRALGDGPGNALVNAEIRRVLAELVREELPPRREHDGASRELIVQFVAGGFVTVIHWWLDREPNHSPSEVDAIFRRMVIDGVGDGFGAALRA